MISSTTVITITACVLLDASEMTYVMMHHHHMYGQTLHLDFVYVHLLKRWVLRPLCRHETKRSTTQERQEGVECHRSFNLHTAWMCSAVNIGS